MPIYEITDSELRKLPATQFAKAGLYERGDLQRLFRSQIDIISPDTLVISEEYGQWEDSRRRIDLLGVDRDANLVVIELKRTEDGGRMELQSLRYAAMVATLTFEQAVEVYRDHLSKTHPADAAQAESKLLDFLGWEEPVEEDFGADVRIVLASADFGRELTTTVLWLNDRGMDIRCVRMIPYADNGRVLLDVQQVIPLPEAADLIIRQKQKASAERKSRAVGKDYTRYDLSIDGVTTARMPKRRLAHAIINYMVKQGIAPNEINAVIDWRPTNLFRSTQGKVDSETFIDRVGAESVEVGKAFEKKRYFCDDGDLIYHEEKTYAVSTQWGGRAVEAMEKLIQKWPDFDIAFAPSI